MSETVDDNIDDLIEYELTAEGEECVEEEYEQDYIQVKQEEEEEILDTIEFDVKHEELEEDEQEQVDEQEQEDEQEQIHADELLEEVEDVRAEGEEEDEVVEELLEEVGEEQTRKLAASRKHTGPKRYLLFDELIALIVDYDADGTPIVEFALAAAESLDKLPVECGICPDVMHKSKLSEHLSTHLVAGTNKYQCIYCTETYKDYKYLAGHARRHMGIRPYVCEICKLYFSTKQDLRVHNQRRHQAKDLICEICGKSFSQNTMLKRHRESTHEKKRRFQCEHCPKAYYKKFSLQEHVRNVHMGDRRMLVCPFCGMQCRDAHKMARHRRELHLNKSHYECHICEEAFTDINYFDAHKRSIQCRNNTKRKMEQDLLQIQQQDMEEELVYEITVESNGDE